MPTKEQLQEIWSAEFHNPWMRREDDPGYVSPETSNRVEREKRAAHERTYKKWFGKRIELTNTCNYTGEQGVIIEIDWNSTDPNAIYGYHIKTRLDSGLVVTSHKFEGLTILNDGLQGQTTKP